MRYEMQNFIKMTKVKSNVGPNRRRQEWKIDRKKDRSRKLTLRNSVTNYRTNKIS